MFLLCEACAGKGYTIYYYERPTEVQGVTTKTEVLIWCKECYGSGEKPYDGDRNSIQWERE